MDTVSNDECIFDSIYPVHICSRKECFDTFQEKKTDFVSLGNRFTCDITGVGIVKIKMFKYFGWCGICFKDTKEFNILRSVGL